MVRLAVTVDPLCSQLSGIGRYTLEICKGLQRRSDVQDILFYRNGRWISDPGALLLDKEICEASPPYLPRFWNARRHRRRYLDRLFHGTNFFLPAQAEAGVITVHDLSVLRFPEMHPAARIRAFEREFQSSVDRAAHIITPSETIRREVIELLHCSSDRVTAIPLAAGKRYHPRPLAVLRDALAKWGLEPGCYALSVATIEPRKKLEQSLAAWEKLPTDTRRRWPLVIVGAAGWHNDSIRSRIERGTERGWIRDLGYFPEDELPLLYAGARLLLYPSTYEGFGLPAVEAMASGTPCVVSGRSCLSEVTKGAAMQVDPDEVSAFAAAIERALNDEQWRTQAGDEGLRVASGYSWEKCVAETANVYRKALADAG